MYYLIENYSKSIRIKNQKIFYKRKLQPTYFFNLPHLPHTATQQRQHRVKHSALHPFLSTYNIEPHTTV